jgi:hypothetical protein
VHWVEARERPEETGSAPAPKLRADLPPGAEQDRLRSPSSSAPESA